MLEIGGLGYPWGTAHKGKLGALGRAQRTKEGEASLWNIVPLTGLSFLFIAGAFLRAPSLPLCAGAPLRAPSLPLFAGAPGPNPKTIPRHAGAPLRAPSLPLFAGAPLRAPLECARSSGVRRPITQTITVHRGLEHYRYNPLTEAYGTQECASQQSLECGRSSGVPSLLTLECGRASSLRQKLTTAVVP